MRKGSGIKGSSVRDFQLSSTDPVVGSGEWGIAMGVDELSHKVGIFSLGQTSCDLQGNIFRTERYYFIQSHVKGPSEGCHGL